MNNRVRGAVAFDRPAGSQVARVAHSPVLLDNPGVMGERLARRILGSTALAVAMGAPQAAGAAEPCVRLEAEGEMSQAWGDAIDELRRQLAQMPPVECRPVTLVVATRGDAVLLVAVAQDGRRAERELTRPSALAPTALGLILSIPGERADATPAGGSASPAPRPAGPPPEPPAKSAAPPAADAAPGARSLQVGVGFAAGGRVSAPAAITMVDLEGRADLFVDHWFFLASFRYVPLGLASVQGVDADVYREIAVALGAGRRFALGGGAALDVALSPALIAMRLETDVLPGNESADVYANDIELRLGASARLAVPLGRRWALTVTADTDVAPASLPSPKQVGTLLPFPTWTGGLRLGASGALL
jgi:hypothetical protein